MCKSSILKKNFLVFKTLHCQSTDTIRIRIRWKFSGSGSNKKKIQIRNPQCCAVTSLLSSLCTGTGVGTHFSYYCTFSVFSVLVT